MYTAFVTFLVICIFVQRCNLLDANCIDQGEDKYKYYLLKTCHRSNKTVVGVDYVQNLSECIIFTKNVQGLAFNFASIKRMRLGLTKINRNFENGTSFPRKSARRHMLSQPEEFFNCIALDCPETINFTSIISDQRFDYYSLYTNPPPPENATCLPGIGVFQFNHNPLTFNNASISCSTESRGALAHVASEKRTNFISSFLAAMYERSKSANLAFVGLNFSTGVNRGEFMTSEWESLRCFLFRAWAPGYPKNGMNSGCVAITKEKSWITTDCKRKLASICEIYTTGPSGIRKRRCY